MHTFRLWTFNKSERDSVKVSAVTMTSAELLRPGESIRPTLTLKQAERLLTKLYGYRCVSIGELDSYDDRNFKVTVRNSCNNEEKEYVLKVLNSLDSRKTSAIEAQNELLLYLCKFTLKFLQ